METSRRFSPPVHRTIIAVGIEGFGLSHRTDRDREMAHNVMFRLVIQGVSAAWGGTESPLQAGHARDRGDGMLFVLPPELTATRLLTSLPERLARELRAHNQTHGAEHRLQLWMAMHEGEVELYPHFVSGMPLDTTCRLLDGERARGALAGSSAELALVMSDRVYDEVVRHAPDLVPAAYRPVTIQSKDADLTGWIRFFPEPSPEPPVTDRVHGVRPEVHDFDEFYLENFRFVRNVVNARAQDWTLAAEVTDEAMTIAHRKWDELRDHPNAVGFVVVTARRILSKVQRRMAKRTPLITPVSLEANPGLEAEAGGTDPAQTAVDRTAIDRALRALPTDQRECFVLHEILDHPIKSIAERLNLPEGTVKTRLRAARRALRELLGEHRGEEE